MIENVCNNGFYITACNLYTEFSCKDSTRCIPRENVCDRFADCDDQSDEEDGGAECSKSEFYQFPRLACAPIQKIWVSAGSFNLQYFL